MSVGDYPGSLRWGLYPPPVATPPIAGLDAFTFCNVGPPSPSFTATPNGFQLSVDMPFSFSQTKSWVVGGKQSDDLLNHEQGHLDISWILAWECCSDLEGLEAKTVQELKNQVVARWNQRVADGKRIESLYDSTGETNHGGNPLQQDKWDKIIMNAYQTNDTLDASISSCSNGASFCTP